LSVTRLDIEAAKKTALMKQNMRQVAELLAESPPNESKARLRTEALIQDDNTITAYEILKAECELLVERASIIDHLEECPADLVGYVSDIIYAAPRLSITEMTSVRRQFRKKYGRSFKSRAMTNEGGILNQRIVSNLALQPPTKATVNLYMEKICKQHEIGWSPATIELSQRHVVVSDAAKTPEIPVTTGMQDTDSDILHGRARNLASLDVLPPPPPVAPGYHTKNNNNDNNDNNNNDGNDTVSVTSHSSRSDSSPGGGDMPVAVTFDARPSDMPSSPPPAAATTAAAAAADMKSNYVACY